MRLAVKCSGTPVRSHWVVNHFPVLLEDDPRPLSTQLLHHPELIMVLLFGLSRCGYAVLGGIVAEVLLPDVIDKACTSGWSGH